MIQYTHNLILCRRTCNTVLNILGKTVMKVFFSFQVILVKTAANLAWHCKSCLEWFCRTCLIWFCRTCLAWHCSAIPRIAQSAASIPAIAQSKLINSNHNHVLIRIDPIYHGLVIYQDSAITLPKSQQQHIPNGYIFPYIANDYMFILFCFSLSLLLLYSFLLVPCPAV
jgi:hypothetical protein